MAFTVAVSVPDTIYQTLIKTASQTGQPIEAVAAEWLRLGAQHRVHDPLEAFIGAFDSGGTPWADNHDSYLGQTHNIQPDQVQN